MILYEIDFTWVAMMTMLAQTLGRNAISFIECLNGLFIHSGSVGSNRIGGRYDRYFSKKAGETPG